MTKSSNTPNAKPSTWKYIMQFLEAMEKTHTDHMYDEMARLRTRQDELEQELRASKAAN